MGKLALFVAMVGEVLRAKLSLVFDAVDVLFEDFGFVLQTYGEPLKEFVETTVIKIEAFSETPVGKAALAAASLSNPKLAMAISAYENQFVPLVESQRGKPLEAAAKELLLKELEERINKYVSERNDSGGWKELIDAEKAARPQ